MKQKDLVKVDVNVQEFKEIIKDITQNSSVVSLREHVQHMRTSRYEHCYHVAFYTYAICKRLGLDYISAARGAMLHDFYFCRDMQKVILSHLWINIVRPKNFLPF